ncbi:hypothetical protein B0H10DRAFT_1950251 [Mycena sp. CBHHK59/15]|nr:hypothetical protein B0H10DRAFT_1950251 [Mycena sp. CBHHK59/15]
MTNNSGISGQSSDFINTSSVAPILNLDDENLVFLPEVRAVFEKVEERHLQRNLARAMRRETEDEVSDDEVDEFAPFIVRAPSGPENNLFCTHDNTIPMAIFSLAKNRISPPLMLFSPASLEYIHSVNVKTVKHGTGEASKTLDQASWFTTYNTFLAFLEIAAGKQIY